MEIKELSKDLIQRANSVSFNGTRGNNSEHDYKIYVQKILDFPVSDEKKQKLLDTLYDKWCKLLNYEAQHVSVMVAGPAKYNAKKLDKGDQILRMYSEIGEWYDEIQKQADMSGRSKSKVESLVEKITWCVSDGFSVTDEWKKLAKISKDDFKKLYENLNEKYPFKKNTVAYKLYHNLGEVIEQKKEIICDNADYTAYTEGNRAYIRFTLRPKRQLIVALKSRGWWWNSRENAWSTYLDRVDKEWVSSISEKYSKYI